jgi:hypothetical protein
MPAAPQREILQGVATSRTNSRAAACPTAEGDCFEVINSRGEYRDGIGWVPGWDGAIQFRLPTPAHEMCDVATREAKRLTNVSGVVGYIPPGTPSSVVPHASPLGGALPGLRRRPLLTTAIYTGIYSRGWPDMPTTAIGASDLATALADKDMPPKDTTPDRRHSDSAVKKQKVWRRSARHFPIQLRAGHDRRALAVHARITREGSWYVCLLLDGGRMALRHLSQLQLLAPTVGYVRKSRKR